MPSVDLSVGHGVKPDGTYDPGATAQGGHPTEQSEGDPTVARVAEVLEAHGVDVLHSEAYTEDPNYPGSIDRINNRTQPDLAVTIHRDWRGAPRGFFCHWFEGSVARRAADAMYARAGEAGFPRRPDWHRPRNELAFVRKTTVPAVLVECDRVGVMSDEEIVRLADAIAGGILAYFGIAYQSEEEREQEYDYDVAVIFAPDSPDDVAARAVGLEHIYKALPVGHRASVGHAILFGAAQKHADDYEAVTTLSGSNRQETAELVIEATGNGPSRERKHPTAADLRTGQG